MTPAHCLQMYEETWISFLISSNKARARFQRARGRLTASGKGWRAVYASCLIIWITTPGTRTGAPGPAEFPHLPEIGSRRSRPFCCRPGHGAPRRGKCFSRI